VLCYRVLTLDYDGCFGGTTLPHTAAHCNTLQHTVTHYTTATDLEVDQRCEADELDEHFEGVEKRGKGVDTLQATGNGVGCHTGSSLNLCGGSC